MSDFDFEELDKAINELYEAHDEPAEDNKSDKKTKLASSHINAVSKPVDNVVKHGADGATKIKVADADNNRYQDDAKHVVVGGAKPHRDYNHGKPVRRSMDIIQGSGTMRKRAVISQPPVVNPLVKKRVGIDIATASRQTKLGTVSADADFAAAKSHLIEGKSGIKLPADAKVAIRYRHQAVSALNPSCRAGRSPKQSVRYVAASGSAAKPVLSTHDIKAKTVKPTIASPAHSLTYTDRAKTQLQHSHVNSRRLLSQPAPIDVVRSVERKPVSPTKSVAIEAEPTAESVSSQIGSRSENESPFLPEAKVIKRPLGGGAPNEVKITTDYITPMPDLDEPAADNDELASNVDDTDSGDTNDKPADNFVGNFLAEMRTRRSGRKIAIEDNANGDAVEDEQPRHLHGNLADNNDESHSVKPSRDKHLETDYAAARSVQSRYAGKYLPAKRRGMSLGWILLLIGVIIAGSIAGVALYYYGI